MLLLRYRYFNHCFLQIFCDGSHLIKRQMVHIWLKESAMDIRAWTMNMLREMLLWLISSTRMMKGADVMMMNVAASCKKKRDTDDIDESSCVTKFDNTSSSLSIMQELLQLACVWHTNTLIHLSNENRKKALHDNTPNLHICIDHQNLETLGHQHITLYL